MTTKSQHVVQANLIFCFERIILIMLVSLVFIIFLQEVCAMESMQIMDKVTLHKMILSLFLFYFWLYHATCRILVP